MQKIDEPISSGILPGYGEHRLFCRSSQGCNPHAIRSERMGVNDDFWEDLLSHIRDQRLVPVTGPDLTVVNVGHAEQTLATLIGQRLAERFHLTLSPGMTTMGEAVAAFLHERGHDEVERLYRVINDLIVELDPVPGDALRDLAAITDLRLFGEYHARPTARTGGERGPFPG
jgi:hypothetical protein